MRINLNIIKIGLLVSLSMGTVNAYNWLGTCPTCGGCTQIAGDIKSAAKKIDNRHKELENTIKQYYKEKIIDPELKKIDTIQKGITQSVARINAMEYQANVDSRKLIWSLRQIKELYLLPVGKPQ